MSLILGLAGRSGGDAVTAGTADVVIENGIHRVSLAQVIAIEMVLAFLLALWFVGPRRIRAHQRSAAWQSV